MALDNKQLCRTLPTLGGNLQLDLILDWNVAERRYLVSDFHLSPISPRIPYVYRKHENLLNTAHRLNIKKFYEQTKSQFYSPVIAPELASEQFLPDNYDGPRYDDTYWAGTKRIPVARYDREFSSLVPLWLESFKDATLQFEITLGTETRVLSLSGGTSNKFHNKFCTYLQEYFNYLNDFNAGQNCISVDFKSRNAQIYGLDVSRGIYASRDCDELVANMMFRERPLLENNFRIADAYRQYNLIAPQLINFNLIYNWDSPEGVDYYKEKKVFVNVAGFEKSDFFTNHYFINRPVSPGERPRNSLDYLQDYNASELVHENKIAQSVCHWSYRNNVNHLFNVYDGFGIDDEPHKFGNMEIQVYSKLQDIFWPWSEETQEDLLAPTPPNGITLKRITGKGSDADKNTIQAILDDTSTKTFGLYISSTKLLKKWMSPFAAYVGEKNTGDESWNRDIRQYNDVSDKYLERAYRFYGNRLGTNDIGAAYKNGKVPFSFYGLSGQMLFITYKGNDILVWTYEWGSDAGKRLSIKEVDTALRCYRQYYTELFTDKKGRKVFGFDEDDLKTINELLAAFNEKVGLPDVIYFTRSILPVRDTTISPLAKEIKYKKIDRQNRYVLRYSGEISPTIFNVYSNASGHYSEDGGFIYGRNTIWVKDKITELGRQYLYTNVPPRYPSLGYCSLHYVYFHYDYNLNDYASKWFDDSLVRILPRTLDFQWTTDNIYKLTDEEIIKKLPPSHNKSMTPSDLDLYNIKYDFKRAYLAGETMKYEYDVIIELK